MRRDISAQTLLMSALLLLLGLRALAGCIDPARAEVPAVAVQAVGDGALLTWVTTHNADSVTITRCRKQACVFVDIVPVEAGRPETYYDRDAEASDVYRLSFYHAHAGALDWVADDGPYAVPFAAWLPEVQ